MRAGARHSTADAEPGRIDQENIALLTDQYELTMLQAYRAEGMDEPGGRWTTPIRPTK